ARVFHRMCEGRAERPRPVGATAEPDLGNASGGTTSGQLPLAAPAAIFFGGAMAAIAEKLSVRAPEDWGVQPVPFERRALRAFDFAVLWGDLAVSLLVMVAGTLLVPGLGTQQAILVIIIGTALGTVLLALAGMIGTNTGVPTMVALRAPFGVRGSYLASGLNILQLVGWAALEIIIMAQAAEALSDEYLGFGG